MSFIQWCLLHSAIALFWLWILKWGGAQWVEGWKSFFLIEWFALSWNEEQIRFYALLMLIIQAIWFLLGAVKPELRVWIYQ